MRIVRIDIQRFRSIRSATLFPEVHNVYLGPNNIGKTTILEALNLLLNPEIGTRGSVVDENDFYRREYRVASPVEGINRGTSADDGNPTADRADNIEQFATPQSEVGADNEIPAPAVTDAAPLKDAGGEQGLAPFIRIEAVLTGLTKEDTGEFSSVVVPWNSKDRTVVERSDAGQDPFEGAETAIRPCLESWYDEEEDDFAWRSFFRTDPELARESYPTFGKHHKRRIGFLIYRDFRALHRPITLEPNALFGRLLQSQDATPRNFESVLDRLHGSVSPLLDEPNFARVVNEYRQELLRYLPLANIGEGQLSLEATDRTREEVKSASQIYVEDEVSLPLQKMGAGTRSLGILAILLLIARKRGRGIIALEEPETFLFPHAQRRVIDEVLALASQTFVTTHSPYVLERVPVEAYQRLLRDERAAISTTPLVTDIKIARQIRDRFRKQLSEALLGWGAIVVEEESTRLWILKASALLNGTTFEGSRVEALELQGVAVVTAAGNGDVPNVGNLLRRAGLQVVCFLDQVGDAELKEYMRRDPDLPLLFHGQKGLEDLLLRELPRSLVREVLIAAPYSKHTYDAGVVDNWPVNEFTAKAREFFRQHKGHLLIHEWILEQLDINAIPTTFKRLVGLVTGLSTSGEACSTRSLIGTY